QSVNTGKGTAAPTAPQRSGYIFVGWYQEITCMNTWNFSLDTITGDMTLYAKWVQDTYSVSGIVGDEDSKAVKGATVKMMMGNTQFGAAVLTDDKGKFTITGVPAGNYNIVVTKDNQTVTLYISVSGDYKYAGQITLPMGNKSSEVDIVGTGTPDVVEKGLNDLFEKDKMAYNDDDEEAVVKGGTVKIKLTVQKDDSSEDRNTVVAEMSSDGYKSGIVLDVAMEKTVTDSSGAIKGKTPITKLQNPITLIIPLPEELQGKSNYVVYRIHDYDGTKKTEAITTTANAVEYIEVSADKTYLTLHAKFFSAYAIGYTEGGTPSPSSNSGSDSDSGQSYSVTVSTGKGGRISPSGSVRIEKGADKTFTFTPDEGYAISDVLIDGKSVGAVSSYTFKKMDTAHTIRAVFVKAEGLPYYLDNSGSKVFVGFASDASGKMNYIAPKGKAVLFTPNPKNFTDTSGHWAKSYIDFVTQRELFVGTDANTFSPDSGMTRAMFAAVIGRLYERSYGPITVTGETFADVPDGKYYKPYVLWAQKNGIILGIKQNQFAPNRKITREEMAAILYRFAEFMRVSGEASATELTYSDLDDVHAWAIDAVKYCRQNGIIVGRTDGSFAPKDTATRAEVATILNRFIEVVV
ncbi:S-layer homology domain-containing protein, partial [Oscillibacter sp.]|uniref:S-layer homology domain-containing protein n=1 Tax=Oscillibacter sp. TaxID=1945593 RepID=UPI0028A72BEF